MTVQLPVNGCTDATALDYNSLATCDTGCTYCVDGCTDGGMWNYNPAATCDDGTCIPYIYGCTDATAGNYNSLANTDDGSCVYPNCGCTDPLALNYGENYLGNVVGTPPPCDDGGCLYCDDPVFDFNNADVNITVSTVIAETCTSKLDGSIRIAPSSVGGFSTPCNMSVWTLLDVYWFSGVTNSNVSFIDAPITLSLGAPADIETLVIPNLPGGYTYTLILQDCVGCQMQYDIFVGTTGTDCGCMDPAADNYDISATIDNGSCTYGGCTDTGAVNYNPGATFNDYTCEYPPLLPPCIPPSIEKTLTRLEACISKHGLNYYNKLITGRVDNCSIMNVWKIILIDYLLKRRGLDCVYNCADANTPNAADVYKSCNDLWVTGGPNTGLNDTEVTGTGVGTTSTIAMFASGSSTFLSPGDIIKHHNSGNIWIFSGPGQIGNTPVLTSIAGLDPENASGNASGYWRYCTDDMRYTSNENNINYIDNFINFANTFCSDCGSFLTAPITSNLSNPQLGTTGPPPDPEEEDADIIDF
jgi:hypothetical protein